MAKSSGEAVKKLAPIYAAQRDWVRREIAAFCETRDATPEPIEATATVAAPAEPPASLFPADDTPGGRAMYGPGADG